MLRNKMGDLPHTMILDKQRTGNRREPHLSREEVIMKKRNTFKGLLKLVAGIAVVLLLLVAPSRAQACSNPTYTVKVNSGYLALRTYPSYEDWNEIGELYTGDVVTVLSKPSGDYWWVYSSKYNREGYVNKNYLV